MDAAADSTRFNSVLLLRFLAAACVTLAGCAGPVLLKEAQPFEMSRPLAGGKDERISVSIDTVILRNGAGSWARDAEWDEYLIRIRAPADESVEIQEIAIFDALEQRIVPRSSRGELADGTREIEQRYVKSGQLVQTRQGNGWAVAGASLTGVAGLTAFSAPAGFAGMATVGAAALVATGVGVVFAGAGVMRLLNNAEVNAEIKRRQTTLPASVAHGAEATVDLFFPTTPLSRRVEVVYADRNGVHRLNMDTRQALIDLDPPPAIVTRHDPAFPHHALRVGIDQGYVRAQLTLDREGHVQDVEVTESAPRRVFDEEARRTFRRWIYNKSRFDSRTVEARLDFKR